jgi:hypothetical protein
MALHHDIEEWTALLDEALVGRLDRDRLVEELWHAVEDLRRTLALVEIWRGSAGRWEQHARLLEDCAHQQQVQKEEVEKDLGRRLRDRDAALAAVNGQVDALKEQLRQETRSELAEARPQRVEEVARRTWQAFRKGYGLRRGWEDEPEHRQEDFRRTIALVMQALAAVTGEEEEEPPPTLLLD